MNIDYTNHRVGSVQAERKFTALDPNYVKIDELQTHDLLYIIKNFSKIISYYKNGRTSNLYIDNILKDEIFVLAEIINFEDHILSEKFISSFEKFKKFNRPEKKDKYKNLCFTSIFEGAKTLNKWVIFLKENYPVYNKESNILSTIRESISNKIAPLWATFIQMYEPKFIEDFDLCWKETHETSQNKNINIEDIFSNIIDVFIQLKQTAPSLLLYSLNENTHKPHISLLLTFLEFYKLPQKQINKLGLIHLEHYYKKILQQSPYSHQPDRTYIQINLDRGAKAVRIKQSTPFVAGETKEGKKLLYRAEYPTIISQTKAVQGIVFHKSSSIKLYLGEELQLVNGLYNTQFNILDYEQKSPTKQAIAIPPFGEEQQKDSDQSFQMEKANMGLAIASPIFRLSEGERHICIRFILTESSFIHFKQLLSKLKSEEKESEDSLYAKAILEIFDLYITSPSGWHTVSEQKVNVHTHDCCLEINLYLKSTDPKWGDYNADIHSKGKAKNFPMIYLKVRSDNYIYGYSLLQPLQFSSIKIKANVQAVTQMNIFNQIGRVNHESPFQAFGPTPKKGAYLLIGNNEIFNKKLDSLSVNIYWFQLPETAEGLFGIYKNYPQKWDNRSFKGNIYILQDGKWVILPQGSQYFFQTTDAQYPDPQAKGPLQKYTQWKFDQLSKLEIPHQFDNINQQGSYDKLSKRGFIKIELDQPNEGFGHLVYPAILTEITTHNAQTSFFKKAKKKAVPDHPYTPQIEGISIDYTTSQEIHGLNEAFVNGRKNLNFELYHFHPYGHERVFPNNNSIAPTFLPQINYDGALHIALENINPPETINLFFEMTEASNATSEDNPPYIEWAFLSENKWHQISSDAILLDTTQGFLKTGIIQVNIQQNIPQKHTIFDQQYFWIRASATGNIHVSSKIKQISTQFISLKADSNTNIGEKYTSQQLPPYQIKRGLTHIKGIRNIKQPLPSYDGVPEEQYKNFTFRIAERLRHKQRAITCWDFERLVLEKFQQINQVQCLPNLSTKNAEVTNAVLIIVSPYTIQNNKLVSSELLFQIKAYLCKLTSSFCQIEVSNPTYEKIKVLTSVKFKEGHHNGASILKLHQEISAFIDGPSVNDRPLNLGGHLNMTDLKSYLGTLPYVNYLTKFSIVQTAQKYNGQYTLIDTARMKGDQLKATHPWSILISADNHQIELISDEYDTSAQQAGISHLALGDDFIIEQ
ncbi:hypothetical protein [Persicobacter psychrovividus]|uniref:Baseplate protein J-like domain-containing protein n=1 Tax=Persicobacter psychrovividus TaxID=387638 RepID=A0ABN6LDV6_9BACT|nr:hypothetical protein PEPS_36330 [Persicobacter psychrovividus]